MKERLDLLDAEHIDAAVITRRPVWEAELDDAELSQATRAYNRWICEWCPRAAAARCLAHLSLGDPVAAADELVRAVGEGARVYVAVHAHRQAARPSHHDVVFAAAQDHEPPAIHPTFGAAMDQGQPDGRGRTCAGATPHRRCKRPTACANSPTLDYGVSTSSRS